MHNVLNDFVQITAIDETKTTQDYQLLNYICWDTDFGLIVVEIQCQAGSLFCMPCCQNMIGSQICDYYLNFCSFQIPGDSSSHLVQN